MAFTITETTESCPGASQLPQAGTAELAAWMVSPQPTTFDIAVPLQKEDLKEALSCHLNKRGFHREREQSSHGL